MGFYITMFICVFVWYIMIDVSTSLNKKSKNRIEHVSLWVGTIMRIILSVFLFVKGVM
jgi:hypothetical protein